MHQQSSRFIAAFRVVHGARLGREIRRDACCSHRTVPIYFLEDPDNPERLCSAVRVLRLSISISFEARTPLKLTHLHTSATVNLSSAILAIWRTVSLPPAYLLWRITN
jgi:hypothetical protein